MPKTQFTSAEAHGTFARRVDGTPIIDVSANASGSEQGQATGKRGKAPATNVTLRGDGADYAYPIGKVPGLRSGAGTSEPGESNTRPGNGRLLPRLAGGMGRPPTVGQWRRHNHRVKRPGGAGTLGKVMGVTVRSGQLGSSRWRRSGINESKQSKELKGEERSEKRGILGGLFDKMKKGTGKAKPDGHRRAAEGDGGGVVDV